MKSKISFDVTDKDYLDIVALEVRGELDGYTSEELRREEHCEQLYKGLVALKRNIETQLSNKKSRTIKDTYKLRYVDEAPLEEIERLHKDYADWRAKATRFLGAIELEISDTKTRLRKIKTNEGYINELVELISMQMEEIDEDQYTDADERVFAVARKIKENL